MSMWSAVSWDDYLDEQEGYGRSVKVDCVDCGQPVRVAKDDGPPLVRIRCTDCLQHPRTVDCHLDNEKRKGA